MANISNNIKINKLSDIELINKWNLITDTLIKKHIVREIEISPVMADKYKFDLFGLFRNEINIPIEHIYPHIRVNGYDSSNCYDGGKLRLKIIDANIINNYYKLFTK